VRRRSGNCLETFKSREKLFAFSPLPVNVVSPTTLLLFSLFPSLIKIYTSTWIRLSICHLLLFKVSNSQWQETVQLIRLL
jgi:hypothetical protein